jgi:hypothetical protein
VLDKWTMDKEVRHALGEDTLPAWKSWLKENDVSLHSFLDDYYPGNLEDMIRRLKVSEIDEWLFDFIHTDDGLKQAVIITPKHPEQAQREDYDPFAKLIGKITRQQTIQNVQAQTIGAPLQNVIPDPKDLMPKGKGRSVICNGGIKVTNILEHGSVSIYKRADQNRYLNAEFGLDEKDLETRTIPAGAKMLIFEPFTGDAETLIEFTNETTARCRRFFTGITSDHWITFDDGGDEALVLGDEPMDYTDDPDEWTQKMSYEQGVYKADYILTHN